MPKQNSMFKDSTLSFSSSGLTLISGIIFSILIARLLGPEGKGTYTLVTLIPMLMISLGNMGINNSAVYFMSKEKENRKAIFITGLKISLLIALSLYAILQLCFAWWHQYYENIPEQLFYITIPLVIIILISDFLHFSVLGMGRVDFFSLTGVLKSLISLGVFLIAFFMPGNTLTNVLIACVISYLMGIVTECYFLKQTQIFSGKFCERPFPAKQLLRFGGITHIITVSQFMSYRIDQLLIPVFLSSSDLGIYTIAVSLAERILMLPAAIQMALLPRIPDTSLEKGANIVARVLRHLIILNIVIIIVISAAGSFLIHLFFGVDFKSAYIPMLLLLPGIVSISFWKIVGSYFISTNRAVIPAVISVFSVILNLFFNLFLIPRWGIIGAASASTISYSFTGLLIVSVFCRNTGLTFKQILIPGRTELNDYKILIRQLTDKYRYLFFVAL